ncbi:MAG: hypothetical protein RBT69_09965, partial [Spirochaetia bacterium]|nr:hypothetical protein [Spirochaetia bacterium]
YLEKNASELKEERILYHDFTPVMQHEVYYTSDGKIEREITRDDNTVTEKKYKNMLFYEEKIINPDKTGIIKKYKYNEKNQLYAVEEFTLDGVPANSVTYERDPKGRIISVVRVVSGVKESRDELVSKYRFSGRNLTEEWHGSSDSTGSFIYYNSDGKISGIIQKKEGETVSEKRYYYENSGAYRTEELITGVSGVNEKNVQYYDTDGNISEEILFRDDKAVLKTANFYSDNRIIKKITTSPRGTERYLYEYSGDKVSGEKMFFNGELVYEKIYTDDENYYEDNYSAGKRYSRKYFKNGEKIKTETW